jgi:AbrB family looped-hinge helix DNA binding protein
VRLSSKGQIIIPASLRRQLGLKRGQAMQARSGSGREIIFSPVDDGAVDLDAMLALARAWYAKTGRDPVKALDRRRRRERKLELRKHERWSA